MASEPPTNFGAGAGFGPPSDTLTCTFAEWAEAAQLQTLAARFRMNAPTRQFLADLDTIPWFSNLGRPNPRDADVFRISSWDIWPGPEDPGVEIQASFHQNWKDKLFLSDSTGMVSELWEEIDLTVRKRAMQCVPYDEQEDAWHGPTSSVWCAGFVAGLIGCYLALDEHFDQHSYDTSDLWKPTVDWYWYRSGHWPCLYYWPWGHADLAQVGRTGQFHTLVVF